MRRRVVLTHKYHESLALLGGSEEVVRAIAGLLDHVRNHPANAEPLPGTRIRMLSTRGDGRFPALRLLFWMNQTEIYLLWIERYDELV